MFERVIENIVDSNTNTEGKKEVIDYESIAKRLNTMGQTSFTASEIEGLDRQATIEKCKNVAFNAYEDKIRPVKNQIMPLGKNDGLTTDGPCMAEPNRCHV